MMIRFINAYMTSVLVERDPECYYLRESAQDEWFSAYFALINA